MKPKDKATLKFKLLKRLTEYIYRHVEEDLTRELSELVRQNNALCMTPDADSFYFGGTRWPERLAYVHRTPILHESLEERAAKAIDAYTNVVLNEQPLVVGFLRKILNSTDDIEQIFRLLPGSLHDAVRDVITSAELRLDPLPIEEVAKLVNASDKSVRLFNIRMMSNLIGA